MPLEPGRNITLHRIGCLIAVLLLGTAFAPRSFSARARPGKAPPAASGARTPSAEADARHPSPEELARWKREAAAVSITRDDWGIAHVHGKTDADAVFGMEYAQAEDDFNRVETNYINALGRLAEAEGEPEIWRDLRMKLFIDPDAMKAKYTESPEWLRKLMDAFADGLNYFLHTHPKIQPRVIDRFEPWMALAFSEGSIGGDIERVGLTELAAFYEDSGPSAASAAAGLPFPPEPPPAWTLEPAGSNGIAIAPKNTLNGHALLYINPHTSFYFRSELQMSSDEGLDTYGAVTWGQFFVYQGFNRTCGWMHTSSGVDNIDEFLETVSEKDGQWFYHHGGKDLPMETRRITVPYLTDHGMKSRTFTAYYTMHGPIVRKTDGAGGSPSRWVSVSLMQRPMRALEQDFERTKAKDLADFERILRLHTNSSNNTVYADSEGHIAYFHSNYIPRRDPSFDWMKPVDGSNPATDYDGVLSLEDSPNAIDPDVGWVYNSNNWPWSAAGPDSPKRSDYPAYVQQGSSSGLYGTYETPRGLHALRLLEGRPHHLTIESLTDLGFDSYLPFFADTIPVLVKAYDDLPASDSLKEKLAGPVTVLRGWDFRWSVNSVATSIAVYWATKLQPVMFQGATDTQLAPRDFVTSHMPPRDILAALSDAVDRLQSDFGSWQTPWGDINRFQRLVDTIEPSFDDARRSIPVAFPSARWGSLASFGARPYENTKKWYGDSGNSFVAAVEFGDKVRARAVTAGGESGDPGSPHFNDEAVRYATGNLRVVYFYPEQLEGHTERVYHPGK
ncbi:MAG TPA: penicillin acylase family protein [Candidatus Saccharimonadales bacterium]|nr:penicillin acylase family protein [Candidatus Saccharimonadales bacterium]